MTTKGEGPDRRRFLTGSVLGAGAMAATSQANAAPAPVPEAPTPATPNARPPWLMAAEAGRPAAPESQFIAHPGSDYMVDCLKALDIDYVALMPGSTFRGLQESIANYPGDGSGPEMIVCVHEEISAGICHGYFKVAGKPMACLVHSNVGLQHASMAIYNAWCDRVPMVVLAGNVFDPVSRRPGVEWFHVAQDLGAMVRDFTKWDDAPVSLEAFGEAAMRAYQLATTAPMEPVLLIADAELQEEEVHKPNLRVPKPTVPSQPAGEPQAIGRLADMLVNAKTPLIVADKAARTQSGMDLLVKLAELLNTPVCDQRGRLNFPNTHWLNHTFLQRQLAAQADVLLGLDLADIYGVTNAVSDIVGRPARRLIKADCKVAHISPEYLLIKSNHGDFERYFAPDLAIAADVEATLPSLIAAVEQRLTPERRQAVAARRPALEDAYRKMRAAAVNDAARGWDQAPISTARLCMEIWDQIKGLDWALVSSTQFQDDWPHRLWSFDKAYQYAGNSGGYGVGYQGPAAVGAALAHRQAGRIPVNIMGDGEFLCAPGSLWTLAHHRIPLLNIMHNNRAWHQETMHLQRMTSRRQRHPERARVGTMIEDPYMDYALIARGQGVWAEGPIAAPEKLGPAIARALAVVKSGKPALLDVLTQPR